MDWKPIAARLKFDEGVSWTQMPQALFEACGVSATKENIRSALRKHSKYNSTKEGQEEVKPAIVDCGDYYIVTSGKRSIHISKNKLRQLKDLYCGDDSLTINQICRKLDIPRRDFVLIKTAFAITHDDVPYIDEDLTDDNIDELVSETLEKRKEKYFIKLQQEEINQLKKEVANYRREDYRLDQIHQVVMSGMETFTEYYQGPTVPIKQCANNALMLEVPIVDLHLGKLAWKPETGENYDYKIADKRFMSVIHDIAERASGEYEKIIFVVGSDFFHFDTINQETTRGTRQDSDVRWQKLFSKGVEMLIKGIDTFSTIAPVQALLVPGNHDAMTSYYAIQHLAAWYRNSQCVKVNTDPRTRKYVEYGKCLIGFTHGDKEKKRIFGNMQVEAAEAWGRTKYREWHAGHLHSEHVKEEHGVIVRNLSSVTGTDSWHYESGYVGAIAKSQSFVWDKNRGLRDIWMTNVE